MFFQELPGLSKFKFYSTNSLPLLSHTPVERRIANCAIAELRDLSTGDHRSEDVSRGLEISQLRNSAIRNLS